jgi:hypothetical protein
MADISALPGIRCHLPKKAPHIESVRGFGTWNKYVMCRPTYTTHIFRSCFMFFANYQEAWREGIIRQDISGIRRYFMYYISINNCIIQEGK